MRKPWPVLALLTLFVSPFSTDADVIKPQAQIISVIVYPDRALVTRSAEFDLTKGEHTIAFENLPANIDTDSVRAKGRGDAAVRILSLESKRIILERPREEQIAQLEEEIQNIKDQIAAAKARFENLNAEREFVRSVGVYAGEQFSKEFAAGRANPGDEAAQARTQPPPRRPLARACRDTRPLPASRTGGEGPDRGALSG